MQTLKRAGAIVALGAAVVAPGAQVVAAPRSTPVLRFSGPCTPHTWGYVPGTYGRCEGPALERLARKWATESLKMTQRWYGFPAGPVKMPDDVIVSWGISPGGADFMAIDTHDTGTLTVSAGCQLRSNACPVRANTTDSVAALVKAMEQPGWSDYPAPIAVFSPRLLNKIRAAGVNAGWVYRMFYEHQAFGQEWNLPWVPPAPQAIRLRARAGHARAARPATRTAVATTGATPPPSDSGGSGSVQPKTVPRASKPVAARSDTGVGAQASPRPNRTPAQARESTLQRLRSAQAQASVWRGAGPGGANEPGAYASPAWLAAHKALVRYVRTRRAEEGGAGLAILVAVAALILLARRRRRRVPDDWWAYYGTGQRGW